MAIKKVSKSKTKKVTAKKKVIVKKKIGKVIKKAISRKPVKGGANKTLLRSKGATAGKEKKIGSLLHYFDKIKVIVVKLSDVLVVGDTIRIKGGKETDFKQKIVSMEIDGKKIKKAKKGQQVGIKVKDKAREGYLVFKI